MNPDSEFLKNIKIDRLLGKGKSAYSYLARLRGRPLVLKKMHDEPCPYYTFTGDKVLGEVEAYKELRSTGIKIPLLHAYDVREQYLLKEYIPGPTMASVIAAGGVTDQIIKQLFQIADLAYRKGLNIDFFPTNFIRVRNELVYIDYEIDAYEEEWNLQNWGIYYWANSRGIKLLLEKNDDSALTDDPDNGLPIKEPFKPIVQSWIEKYDFLKTERSPS